MSDENNIQDVYEDRNLIILLLCVLNSPRLPRLPYGTLTDADEPDWPVVVFDLPTGQVSWHLPKAAAAFLDLPEYSGTYDGHTDAQKRERIRKFLATVKNGEVFREDRQRKRPGFKTAAELKSERKQVKKGSLRVS